MLLLSNDCSVLEGVFKNNLLFSLSLINWYLFSFNNLFVVHSFIPQILLMCAEHWSWLCGHRWLFPLMAPLSSINHQILLAVALRSMFSCFFCSYVSPGLHLLSSGSLHQPLVFTAPSHSPTFPTRSYDHVTPFLKTLPCSQDQTQPLLLVLQALQGRAVTWLGPTFLSQPHYLQLSPHSVCPSHDFFLLVLLISPVLSYLQTFPRPLSFPTICKILFFPPLPGHFLFIL